MAAPPPPAQFKKQDFDSQGLGSQDALERFFTQLNAHTAGTRNALNGQLTLGDNVDAEFKQLTLQAPATDWHSLALANTWVAFGSGFSTPAYRVAADGRVQVKGLIKGGTTSGAVTTTNLPPPAETPVFASATYNGTTSSFCDLRVSSTGLITIGQNAQGTWLSLESISYLPAVAAPGVLSCFPQSVTTKVSSPRAVLLASCIDASGASAPLALGQPSYVLGAPNTFSLTNLPGLLLGHTYTVTLLVLGG